MALNVCDGGGVYQTPIGVNSSHILCKARLCDVQMCSSPDNTTHINTAINQLYSLFSAVIDREIKFVYNNASITNNSMTSIQAPIQKSHSSKAYVPWDSTTFLNNEPKLK